MDEELPGKSARFPNRKRDWSELNPELLALIFMRIEPMDLLLRTVPFVCKSWNDALSRPDCWVHIDIERWCRRVADIFTINFAVSELARRSHGMTKSLYAYKLGNDGFISACTSGKFLQALKMPMSEVTDLILTCHIKSLSMLTKLDISYCVQMTYKSIELIGNQCKSLVEFKRNIPPPCSDIVVPNESEALAVANTMHGLEYLELAYGQFSNHGFDAIISLCQKLNALDVRGCWNVNLKKEYKDKLQHIKDFWPPWENDDLGLDDDDYDDDYDEDDDAYD